MADGFVRKRGKTWTWYLDSTDPGTGRRRQLSKGGFPTQKAANEALAVARSARRDGRPYNPRRITVALYLSDEWLPSLQKRATTLANYKRMINAYLIPRIGELRLDSLTPAHIQKLRDDLLLTGSRTGNQLSSRTVTLALTILRAALSAAVARGYALVNPATHVPNPLPQHREIEAWTAEEAREFLVQMATDRLYAMWLLFLARGPRRGEVCGLRWSDVDLAAGRLSIVKTVVLADGKPVESVPKTAAGRRTIPLDDSLTAALKRHAGAQAEECRAWGDAWTDSGYVFTSEDGNRLHPEWVSTAFEARIARSNIRRISLHGTRHTAATLALRAGIPTEYVSNWLGHSSVSITRDMYQHVTPSLSEKQAAKLTQIVLEGT